MRVTYQDCGCIALPDEVVVALGLSTGSILDISYDAESKVVCITATGLAAGEIASLSGASCHIPAKVK